ncbi:hypothetical protein AVEN_68560-1 [Araneus ventricosus]|uniref:Uncharacterized protein n=1 Tax=Araneus ventricosus TaxID=182803 RepID=A0A4Y2HCW1_ARAVE|nr:hypothetical protein AVEN_68560-1 [Araneus ventricosus]
MDERLKPLKKLNIDFLWTLCGFRTISRRNNTSAEKTQQRHSNDRLRAITRRNNESFELKNQRQASDRLRTLNSRAIQSNEQRESEGFIAMHLETRIE